ncbi:DUF5103 domain-containing protein [Salegentibacter sp. F188]|uniref:DUF5103 domain-containing protein n=1 Tax=Autumnicola patrickiae TaxID=3075591 RepID=A0ABU3E4X5_9FLAO|nr:DUF5103 domain-containing protein [Salegentibacter sp. F188]MDT0691040.1 DUF5103 domain-containing protein [Salegentibacter sp. F188]
MKFFLIFSLFLSINSCMYAQIEHEILPPNYIRSIQLSGSSSPESGNPILQLGEVINLSFDDIIGDEADYYYTIQHYNYDWSLSQLTKAEYLEGFDDIRIFNYQNSLNTLQPFSHYELQIPNSDTGNLKVTGNYMIKIFNAERELVFSRKFVVYQPIAQVGVAIKRSRELNFIDQKQIVNFSINSPDFLLKNPEQNVKVLILQNQNFKTALKGVRPQYTMGNELIYRYDQQTAFWGGNEYIQFDNKELRATTADIDFVEVNELYHHHLFQDFTRAGEPYTFNPDINGGFVVRNLRGQNSDLEAEYVWVHFQLKNYDPLDGGEIHLYGKFNNFELDETTKLTFNEESGFYEGVRLFKQGFYNYKYVLLEPNGILNEGFISGNHDETENEYQVVVYYRMPGARYDRVIGLGTANSVNISN